MVWWSASSVCSFGMFGRWDSCWLLESSLGRPCRIYPNSPVYGNPQWPTTVSCCRWCLVLAQPSRPYILRLANLCFYRLWAVRRWFLQWWWALLYTASAWAWTWVWHTWLCSWFLAQGASVTDVLTRQAQSHLFSKPWSRSVCSTGGIHATPIPPTVFDQPTRKKLRLW